MRLLPLVLLACTSAPTSLPADQAPVPTAFQWIVGPMVRGTSQQVRIFGAPPNRTVYMLASNAASTRPSSCPPQLAGECFTIPGGELLIGQAVAGSQGNATITLSVPNTLALPEVAVQAVARDGATVFRTEALVRDVRDPVPEICGDAVDNDGVDGADCADPACASDPLCGAQDEELGGAMCTDGIDNDEDGFTDCADFGCQFDPAIAFLCGTSETTLAECTDGLDNEGDGFTDCADFGCMHAFNPELAVCIGREDIEAACDDGVDGDLDGLVDCTDPDCGASGACGGPGIPETGPQACRDGLDNDGDLLLDCSDTDCHSTSSCGGPVIVVNELLFDPDGDPVLGDANCDGGRDATDDEFVEIVNTGVTDFDLSGATLSDADRVRHVFGPGTIVPPGGGWLIFGGGSPRFDGTLNPSPWCQGLSALVSVVTASEGTGLSLNNGGDTITLERNGDILYQEVVGAVPDQSMNAEIELDGEASLVPHQSLPNAIGPQSPGRRADGSPFFRP
jgi:hypothetical protein